MGLWINKKRFWAVKLIYNNESLNNSIKDDRGVLSIKMRNENENGNENENENKNGNENEN